MAAVTQAHAVMSFNHEEKEEIRKEVIIYFMRITSQPKLAWNNYNG
jgi:hypothetical protein